MNKFLPLLLASLLSSSLFAYSDADMDGVADNLDKCPNTPLTDLVDINGCTKEKLTFKKETISHADIIIGANYSGSNFASLNSSDTLSGSIQADYYYGNFSLQASTSYYNTTAKNYDDSGLNDSFLGAAYNFHPIKNLSLRLGAGALLPTYETTLNNNNTDYTGSASLSYTVAKVNIFGGYNYTMINDDDVSGTDSSGNAYNYIYQDTNAYSAGLGYYFTNKLYVSGAYNLSNSIYKGIKDIKTASLYSYYSVNKNTFMMFSYAKGLSDSASDNAASVKVGYYF
jgi:predicted porin